jgi:hypothetical protein
VVDIAAARPRYVSAKEAAAMLDNLVTPRDLQRWARQGRIPGAVKVGPKTVRFDRRSVLELVRDLSAELPTPTRDGTGLERPLVWHDRRGHVTFDPRPLN